jgi:uncharacterized protein (UPF0216 family)
MNVQGNAQINAQMNVQGNAQINVQRNVQGNAQINVQGNINTKKKFKINNTMIQMLNTKSKEGLFDKKWKTLKEIVNKNNKNTLNFDKLNKRLSRGEIKNIKGKIKNNSTNKQKINIYLQVMTDKSKTKHKCKKEYTKENNCSKQRKLLNSHCESLCLINKQKT